MHENNTWWVKAHRELSPHDNSRLNPLVIDTRIQLVDNQQSVMDIAVDAVHKIVREYPGPYTVLASGGIDSQVAIWAWKQSGIPFNIVHYSYNGLNSHDTETLLEFCRNNQLRNSIMSFDAMAFIKSDELIKYAIKYDCSSPQILTYVKLTELHSETVIMSGNYINDDGCGLNHTIMALQRHTEYKKNFIPFFLLSTPELAYAFIKTDRQQKISNFAKFGERNFYIAKCETYESAGVPIVRQTSKFTGFERIKELFDGHHVPYNLRIKYGTKESKRSFDFLYRYSLYDYIGEYSEHTTTLINNDTRN